VSEKNKGLPICKESLLKKAFGLWAKLSRGKNIIKKAK
jgi:hypothetical protein